MLQRYEAALTTAEAASVLQRAPHGMEALLTEEVVRSDSAHRALTIRFLADRHFDAAVPALETILYSNEEPQALRAAALDALVRLDPPRGIEGAQKYSAREDRLGFIADRVLAHAHID